MESKNLLAMTVKAADRIHASDIVAMKVDQLTPMADYYVVMSANSDRQAQAIANNIIEQAHKNDVDIESVEGKNHAKWILIDLGDVVVDIFQEETRNYYNLEKLWSEAPRVDLSAWTVAQ